MIVGWPEVPAIEWESFENIISGMIKQGHLLKERFIFRGQSDKEWELAPSLYRTFENHIGYFLPINSTFEWQSVNKFKAMAGQYIPENVRPDDEDLVGWWHLMQHYGVPTRLLDWTRSPYVAAYFAVYQNPDKDGAIWVVNYSQLEKAVESCLKGRDIPTTETDSWYVKNLPLDANFIRTSIITRMNPRAVAQQAESTYTINVADDHGGVIRRFLHDGDKQEKYRSTELTGFTYDRSDDTPLNERKYFKIVIPKESKMRYLARLHIANISASSLFPGLDGVGLAIKEDLVWQLRIAKQEMGSNK
jgi:hypothetical protein